MLIVCVLLIGVFRRRTMCGYQRGGSARDLLDRRYARGEITGEQYRDMRREIES